MCCALNSHLTKGLRKAHFEFIFLFLQKEELALPFHEVCPICSPTGPVLFISTKRDGISDVLALYKTVCM